MVYSPEENEDIDFEPEDELGSAGALQAKMQKLRDELAGVKKERQEYLDGWQRAKADLINVKKEAGDALRHASARGKESFVEELIPALDSFDMAMGSDSWQKVDPAWRVGMESIRAQIVGVLQAHDIDVFGALGETFNTSHHEALQEIEGEGESHTIAKVVRTGYRSKEKILRPAQVVLFK